MPAQLKGSRTHQWQNGYLRSKHRNSDKNRLCVPKLVAFLMDVNQSIAQRVFHRIKHSGLLDEADTAYVFYSRQMLVERLEVLSESFHGLDVLHTVAIKTNPHTGVLRCVVDQGVGLEAASFEEVLLAKSVGTPTENIVYNSPVKTAKELNYCAQHFPGLRVNANSIEELERIPYGAKLSIGLRINPLVNPSTDNLYNVSKEDSKFGVPLSMEAEIIEAAISANVSAIHIHVGSRIEETDMLLEALRRTVQLCDKINDTLQSNGSDFRLTEINFGGGLSALQNIEVSNDLMRKYGKEVKEVMKLVRYRYRLIDEFGQWVHLHNGFAFSCVEYVRALNEKSIAYLHLGADFFPREIYSPVNALNFEFYEPEGELKKSPTKVTDLAGPLCFNGDYLAKNISAPQLSEGDIVAIPSVGANTYGLWSRHCSRTVPTFFSEKIDSQKEIEIMSKRFNPFVNLVY